MMFEQHTSMARSQMPMGSQPRPMGIANPHNWPPIALPLPQHYVGTQQVQERAQQQAQQQRL